MDKYSIMAVLLISSLMFFSGKKEKVVDFRIYVHDVVGGPSPTAIEVARANITADSPFYFGKTLVSYDLMTAGPEPNSPKLGRGHGVAASTGMEELSFTISGVFLFTEGEYKGSSISIMGWKLMVEDNQEIPIVGGTGVFRMARGYTVSNLHSYDPTVQDYLFSFDMHVVCPDPKSGFWSLA